MAAIWKFSLPLAGTVVHQMPSGARPISVAFQGQNLSLWANVNPTAGVESRCFHVILTGQPFNDQALQFIGTAMCDDGTYVVHVFEDPLEAALS